MLDDLVQNMIGEVCKTETQREAETEREQTNDADQSGPRPTVKMTEMLDAVAEIFNGADRETEGQSDRPRERQTGRQAERKRVPAVLSPYESAIPLPRRQRATNRDRNRAREHQSPEHGHA